MSFRDDDRKDETQVWQCDCRKHCRRVLRVMPNGARCVGFQCTRCGNWEIQRKQPGETGAGLPGFDNEIGERYRKLQLQQWERDRQEFRVSRSRAFWSAYGNYLVSQEWRTKRDAVMRRANRFCEACAEQPATQVHHKTYEHVGEEPLFDLVAICEPCHDRLTEISRREHDEDPVPVGLRRFR